MDPDANLDESLRLAARMTDDETDIDTGDAIRLAELVIALNEWIARGGFLPADWKR